MDQNVIETEDEDSVSIFERGLLLYWQGLDKESIPYFIKAANLNYPPSFVRLYSMYEQQKDDKSNYYKERSLENKDWFTQRVLNGNSKDYYHMAVYYEKMEEDFEKALSFYLQAADGYTPVHAQIGYYYLKGIGVQIDKPRGVSWFQKGAEKGCLKSQVWLAWCFDSGEGIDKDINQALYWYNKCAEQGHLSSMYTLATLYESGKGVEQNWNTAFKWYQKASDKGLKQAQHCLGWYYLHGKGTEKNITKGLEWYRKSAEQGYGRAQCALGDYYASRDDMKQAVEWYHKAAEQKIAKASHSLSLHYFLGEGVDKDERKGYYWTVEAAKQGHPQAQCLLASFMETGYPDKKIDMEKSLYWLKKSVEQNCPGALWRLGKHYVKGIYVKRSISEAFRLYQLAADQKDTEGQFQIGKCFYHGRGVTQNYEIAAKWFHQAADNGNSKAQIYIGRCYEHGDGVEQDVNKANEWIQKAAKITEKGQKELDRMIAVHSKASNPKEEEL